MHLASANSQNLTELDITSIGVDIEEVARIEAWKRSYSWDVLQMVFTSSEWNRAVEENQSLAIFFSAKEAVAKALGTGFAGISLNEIEIEADSMRPEPFNLDLSELFREAKSKFQAARDMAPNRPRKGRFSGFGISEAKEHRPVRARALHSLPGGREGAILQSQSETKAAKPDGACYRFTSSLTGNAKEIMEKQNLFFQQGIWAMGKGVVFSFASFGSYDTVHRTS